MSPTSLVLPPPVDIPKMKPEVKEWWAEALDSDRFRKGRGYLRQQHDDGLTYHCCLGVLCEVAIEHGLDLDVKVGEDGQTFFDSETLLLPEKVMLWAGLEKVGPEVWEENDFDSGQHKTELTLVNDDTEAEFSDIAEMIRASL